MNVVKVIGGIGNQFYQYAFGQVLRLRTRKEVEYDITWYSGVTARNRHYPRPLRLPMFQVSGLVVGKMIKTNPIINELRVGYNPGVFRMKNENNFEGYWQYLDYYREVLPALRQEFQLKTEYYTDDFLKWADRIWKSESVSVHVRRGDYQLHRVGRFRDLPASYYFDAIKMIPKGDLFIFSDDLSWCQQTFRQEYFSRNIYFVNIEDYLAFELMRFCKHNIITNSTFSWWAAWLNDYKDKKVIAPEHYLWKSPEESAQLHYPEEWIKIEDYATHQQV